MSKKEYTMKGSLLAAIVLAQFCTSATALTLSLVPNWEEEGDVLYIGLSQTGVVSVHMVIWADESNVAFMNAFFDTTPLRNRDATGYDVIGREFKMERSDGSGWFRAIDWNGDRSLEQYALIAGDDDQEFPRERWGTDAPWEGQVDSIILLGTEVGDYDLYFENRTTVDPGHAARRPQVFTRDMSMYVYYANQRWLPGMMIFRNAWIDPSVGFDIPFEIYVTPEPSSLVLYAVVGLLLVRRGSPFSSDHAPSN
jgi:hypothetical protein